MRRAVVAFVFLLLAACPMPHASAQEVERAPDLIDAAGMVDYLHRPDFSIGTWLKYRTTGSSLQGHKDDYTVTMLVAGEEVWWGEPCFWIETTTQKAGGRSVTTASLVSYAAFGDTMAKKHLVWFIRKAVNGILPNGQPDVNLYARDPSELKLRMANWEQDVDPTRTDSLGADTTTVPAGFFEVTKVRERQGHAESVEQGDSTIFYRRMVSHTYYYSPRVPLTHMVKNVTDDHQEGKTWAAGKYDRGDLRTLERAQGETALVGYGTSGVTPLLVPEEYRKPIDRKVVEEALSMPSEPAVRQVQRTKGGP